MRALTLTALAIPVVLWCACISPNASEKSPLAVPVWTTTLGDARIKDLMPTGARLLIRAAYTKLVSLDPASGRAYWDKTLPIVSRFRQDGKLHDAYFTEEVLYAGGRLYFLGQDERVHVLDDKSGAELGHSAPVFSLLGVTENAVYVLDAARRLTELDALGHVTMQTSVEGTEAARLEISGDRLILRCPTCSLPIRVLDRSARPLWSCSLADLVAATVTADSNQLYVFIGQEHREIVSFDLSTGHELWRSNLSVSKGMNAQPLLLVDGQSADSPLYVAVADSGSQEQYLLIFDRRSGQQESKLRLPWDTSALDGRAVIVRHTLFMTQTKLHSILESFDSGTMDSRLHALDIGTGKELWHSAWRFEVLDTPVVYRDMMYVASWGQYKNPSCVQAFRIVN